MSLNWHNIKSTLGEYARELPFIALRGLANVVPCGNLVQAAYDAKQGHVCLGADTPVHVSAICDIFYTALVAGILSDPALGPKVAIGILPLTLLKSLVGLEGMYCSRKAMQAAGPAGGFPPLAQQDCIEAVVADGRAVDLRTKIAVT